MKDGPSGRAPWLEPAGAVIEPEQATHNRRPMVDHHPGDTARFERPMCFLDRFSRIWRVMEDSVRIDNVKDVAAEGQCLGVRHEHICAEPFEFGAFACQTRTLHREIDSDGSRPRSEPIHVVSARSDTDFKNPTIARGLETGERPECRVRPRTGAARCSQSNLAGLPDWHHGFRTAPGPNASAPSASASLAPSLRLQKQFHQSP